MRWCFGGGFGSALSKLIFD